MSFLVPRVQDFGDDLRGDLPAFGHRFLEQLAQVQEHDDGLGVHALRAQLLRRLLRQDDDRVEAEGVNAGQVLAGERVLGDELAAGVSLAHR